MHWRNGRAYSQDLRDRVLAAVDAGDPVRTVARRYCVSIGYIYRALARRRHNGEVSARTTRGRPPRKLAGYEDAIRAYVDTRQDVTLGDIRRQLAETHGVRVSLHAVWSAVHRQGLTLKKSAARGGAGAQRRRARPPALAQVAALP